MRTALGGTSLYPDRFQDWDPASGELFTDLVANVKTAMDRIRAAGGEPIVHTLWVQGERDQQRTDYGTKLAAFISSYRSEIGQPESTFAVSLLPYAVPARDGQLSVAASVPHVVAIDPVGATTWDGVHYERPTRLLIAESFFTATGATIGSNSAFDNRLAVTGIRKDAAGFTVIGPSYVDYVWSETTARVQIRTGNGDDVIRTGDFDDDITTGGNDDRVSAGGGNDRIDLGAHNDLARAGAGNDTVIGSFGNDWISGEDGDDMLFGDDQNDQLFGGNGDDRLEGGKGDDTMSGQAGRDTLLGGPGADRLAGGADADRFVFGAADFGLNSVASRDVITDFSAAGGDVIDLSLIDADVRSAANDAFTFIGAQPFGKVAGQLRAAARSTFVLLEGDVNGDGLADVMITVHNAQSLPLESIIL